MGNQFSPKRVVVIWEQSGNVWDERKKRAFRWLGLAHELHGSN